MKPLKKNDLVTVVLRISRLSPSLSCTHVLQVGETRFSTLSDDTPHRAFADEGITWMRGHVVDGSPEAQALLAASALVPKFDLALAFTASILTTAPAVHYFKGTLNPTVSIGNNPNPKNDLGE